MGFGQELLFYPDPFSAEILIRRFSAHDCFGPRGERFFQLHFLTIEPHPANLCFPVYMGNGIFVRLFLSLTFLNQSVDILPIDHDLSNRMLSAMAGNPSVLAL
jgi:hypothetical protein